MRENKYDNPDFFSAYGEMPRSREGLDAAGEWHQFRTLLPALAGKRVLDLGCGLGWHCRYAAERGASSVIGVDLSERMLAEAERRNAHPAVEYRRQAIEDVDGIEAFDVVISSLALHYVASFDAVCGQVARLLKKGGTFAFSVEHPVFTASGEQDWCRDADGGIRHWPVDRYSEEGPREVAFLGCRMTKYHRTVSGYLGTLLKKGFEIAGIVESHPDPARPELYPEEWRRPMFLMLSAVRR